MGKQSLIRRYQKSYDFHCSEARKAKRKGQDVALKYHKRLAQQYLEMINVLTEQGEER